MHTIPCTPSIPFSPFSASVLQLDCHFLQEASPDPRGCLRYPFSGHQGCLYLHPPHRALPTVLCIYSSAYVSPPEVSSVLPLSAELCTGCWGFSVEPNRPSPCTCEITIPKHFLWLCSFRGSDLGKE